jgi:hypothetical protein
MRVSPISTRPRRAVGDIQEYHLEAARALASGLSEQLGVETSSLAHVESRGRRRPWSTAPVIAIARYRIATEAGTTILAIESVGKDDVRSLG